MICVNSKHSPNMILSSLFQYLILHVFTILEDIILLGIYQPRARDSIEINTRPQGMKFGNKLKTFKDGLPVTDCNTITVLVSMVSVTIICQQLTQRLLI